MSKKKTQVHWINPSNPYHEAKFEAWLKYTEAYHSYAGIPEQQKLYNTYEIANENYKNNPQTIFNDNIRHINQARQSLHNQNQDVQ